MKQLFHAITSMATMNVNGFDQVDKLAVLKLVATFGEEVPDIEVERVDGNVVWTLKWPIPLTDVVEEPDDTEP